MSQSFFRIFRGLEFRIFINLSSNGKTHILDFEYSECIISSNRGLYMSQSFFRFFRVLEFRIFSNLSSNGKKHIPDFEYSESIISSNWGFYMSHFFSSVLLC